MKKRLQQRVEAVIIYLVWRGSRSIENYKSIRQVGRLVRFFGAEIEVNGWQLTLIHPLGPVDLGQHLVDIFLGSLVFNPVAPGAL